MLPESISQLQRASQAKAGRAWLQMPPAAHLVMCQEIEIVGKPAGAA